MHVGDVTKQARRCAPMQARRWRRSMSQTDDASPDICDRDQQEPQPHTTTRLMGKKLSNECLRWIALFALDGVALRQLLVEPIRVFHRFCKWDRRLPTFGS